jgi:ComF family protein
MQNIIKATNKFLRQVFDSFNFALAPPVCILCNEIIDLTKWNSEHLCQKCFSELPTPLSSNEILKRIDKHFGRENNPFLYAYALFDSSDNHSLLKIIHLLKYTKFQKVGVFLGVELGNLIAQTSNNLNFSFDGIIPIPIHKVRKRERGFNQSEIIGNAIGKVLNLPTYPNLITRNKYTISQTNLTLEQRIKNVQDVFQLDSDNKFLEGKSFLLVDDVITTGSTLYNCGNLLKQNGAKNVFIAVLTTA